MKKFSKVMIGIGLAALALLAVPSVDAADPGRFDQPDLRASRAYVSSLTNVSFTAFATNSLRHGIWFSSSTSGAQVWACFNATNAVATNGVLLTINGTDGGLYLPVSQIGKGAVSLIGTNATSGPPVQATEFSLPR